MVAHYSIDAITSSKIKYSFLKNTVFTIKLILYILAVYLLYSINNILLGIWFSIAIVLTALIAIVSILEKTFKDFIGDIKNDPTLLEFIPDIDTSHNIWSRRRRKKN